jgi:uncharacterized protein (TIGR02118 family)
MARLVVMYRTPKDAAAFDAHYFEGAVATPAGPSNYHLVATLHFDNVAAIQAAVASAQGQAAVADVQTFATGGVDIYMFDNRDV